MHALEDTVPWQLMGCSAKVGKEIEGQLMGASAKIQFLGNGSFRTECKAVPLIRESGDSGNKEDGLPLITAPSIAVKPTDFEFSASIQREGEPLCLLSDCSGGSIKSLMERSKGRLPDTPNYSWVKTHAIGKGAFGEVHMAIPWSPNIDYSKLLVPTLAVKSAEFKHSSSLQKEGSILFALNDCPGIVRCYGEDISDEGNRRVYNLLLEFAPGGSLRNLMQRSSEGKLPESDVRRYTRMILKALRHVHERGYMHYDIRPENILVFPSKNGGNSVKIADFGLAQKIRNERRNCSPTVGGSHHGDLCFASILHGLNTGSKDIWDLGYMVAEMLTGKTVWEHRKFWDLGRQVPLGARKPRQKPLIPQNLSNEGRDFVVNCLDRRAENVWTAERLLKHPFIGNKPNGLVDNEDEMVPSRISVDDGEWVSLVSMFGDLGVLDSKEKITRELCET